MNIQIQASLDAVERSQKTFSATRVERCKINLIDKAARLKLPVVFESSLEEENRENGELEIEPDSRDPPELQECVLQDMLISGSSLPLLDICSYIYVVLLRISR